MGYIATLKGRNVGPYIEVGGQLTFGDGTSEEEFNPLEAFGIDYMKMSRGSLNYLFETSFNPTEDVKKYYGTFSFGKKNIQIGRKIFHYSFEGTYMAMDNVEMEMYVSPSDPTDWAFMYNIEGPINFYGNKLK